MPPLTASSNARERWNSRPLVSERGTERVALELGGAAAPPSARQHLEVGARALLGAGDPVDRGGDDVVDRGLLAPALKLLLLLLGPLLVVVVVEALRLHHPVVELAGELGVVVAHQLDVPGQHLRAVERLRPALAVGVSRDRDRHAVLGDGLWQAFVRVFSNIVDDFRAALGFRSRCRR